MNRIIIFFLTFNIVFQPLATFGQDRQISEIKYSPYSLLKDPLIEELEKADQIPMKLGLAANDPSLDTDPFFLKGQRWVPQSGGGSDQITITSTDNNISISVPMVNTALVIDQRLNIIASTDEFIYLSAKQNFQLFDKESAGLESPGEGIFIVSKDDLLTNSFQKLPVPIYFLPLPEVGWKEAGGAYLEKSDILLLVDENDEALPVPVSDVREVIKAEKVNLLLAQAFTYSMAPDNYNDLRSVLPSSGITAGFGILFTGINSTNLEDSLFAVSSGSIIKDRIADVLHFVKGAFSLNRAEASFQLDPKLAKRLVRVGIVVSVAMVASVTLKFWLYRKYFREKHAGQINRSLTTRLKDQVTDLGDVFAHTLTTFSQVSSVWSANAVEFLGDRYFPQLISANNTVVRKFLNKTVFWVRDTNDRVPVSGRTWVFGSVILGGIDTFCVALQLYGVVPWIGQRIGLHIPLLKSRVDNAFEFGNPNISSINQNETIRNAAAYITTGASSFSQDLQAQLDEKVKSEIKDQMRREGKNSDSAENAEEFKQRCDDRLNTEMQKMGVPSKDAFLFDANSMYTNALKLLGYQIPPEVFTNGIKTQNFIGLNRPGLVMSSARDAIAQLQAEGRINPIGINSGYRGEALEFLTRYNRDLNLLKSFVLAPIKALLPSNENPSLDFKKRVAGYTDRIRSIRQAFMLLTYDGDFENIRSYFPAEWQKYNPQAIQLAAKTFSKIFSDHINGEKEAEVAYAPPERDNVTESQERKALRMASEKFLAAKGFTFNTTVANEEEAAFFKNEYSTALGNVLGLYPDYREKPEAEKDVSDKALQYTSGDLDKPDIQKYLSTLDPEQRFRFEAGVQAANFVKAYKEVVVVSGAFSATSPAQPGRFQKLRQKDAVRNSQVLTRLVRAAEATVAGDQLQTGKKALLERNIPGWYDIKKSNVRAYAGAITRGTATYWFNYFVWGLNLPAHLWALSLVSQWTIGAPSQFLTRFFNYQGAKPMGKISMMGIFALIYTWSTFWGEIPQQILAGDFQHYFDFAIRQHLPESILISGTIMGLLKYKDTIKEKIFELLGQKKKTPKAAAEACGEALEIIR